MKLLPRAAVVASSALAFAAASVGVGTPASADVVVGVTVNEMKGALSIPTSCSITNTVRTGCAGSITMVSGPATAGYPCFAAMVFLTGGTTDGLCSVDNGALTPNSAGTSNATITSLSSPAPAGCGKFTVEKNALHTGNLTFRDPHGTKWLLTDIKLVAEGYQHTAEGDSWTLASGSVLKGFDNNTSRTLTIPLSGALRASSHCAGGIGASNINFDAVGTGTITSP